MHWDHEGTQTGAESRLATGVDPRSAGPGPSNPDRRNVPVTLVAENEEIQVDAPASRSSLSMRMQSKYPRGFMPVDPSFAS